MNTNNAPDRIDHELCEKNARLIIEKADKYQGWECIDYPVAVAYLKMREAMQPQVSEGDEAVAREIGSALYRYFTPDTAEAWQQAAIADSTADILKRQAITAVITAFHKVSPAILASHRQPAAVSANATHAARTAVENIARLRGYEPKQLSDLMTAISDLEPYFQAYGDACRLDGARKMQEAAARIIEPKHKAMSDEAKKAHAEMHKYVETIRALSPETVCGGE